MMLPCFNQDSDNLGRHLKAAGKDGELPLLIAKPSLSRNNSTSAKMLTKSSIDFSAMNYLLSLGNMDVGMF